MPQYSIAVLHLYRYGDIISTEEVSFKIPSNTYKVMGHANAINTSILPSISTTSKEEWARLAIFGYNMLPEDKATLTTTSYLNLYSICGR